MNVKLKINKIRSILPLELRKKLPEIPSNKEAKKKTSNSNIYFNFFEIYLRNMITIEELQDNIDIKRFFEISSIKYESGTKKIKEVYVRKRAGGRYQENLIMLKCGAFCKCWNKRYLIINSEGIMYSIGDEEKSAFIRESLLFDHHFKMKYGKSETGFTKGLILYYSNRKLYIEALDLFSFYDIIFSLREAFKSSDYIKVF